MNMRIAAIAPRASRAWRCIPAVRLVHSGKTSQAAAQASTQTGMPPSSFQPRAKPLAEYIHQDLPETLMDDTLVGKSGGEIFHEMMLRHNVEHVFGYPGGAILPVFDAIYNSKYFNFVLPRHEQGAGHMAEGYARASGKPGVILVTSGPGATNTVTAMQDAMSDGTPIIVFAGQVATSAIGSDAFQEADVVGISRSCTKWNTMVKDVSELPRRINEAFHIATTGRPGPVLVDLPKDVTAAVLQKAIPHAWTHPLYADSRIPKLNRENDQNGVYEHAATLLKRAKKPILYVGQGAQMDPEAPKLVKRLSEALNAPVTTTLMGLGAFDEHDPRSLHMLGMHGSVYANRAMQAADAIVAVGARFDDRVTGKISDFAQVARQAERENRGGIIQFEISPKNVNKVVNATVAVMGDLTHNLKSFLPYLESESPPARTEWFDQINAWKKEFPFYYRPSNPDIGEQLKPEEVIEELDRQADKIGKENILIATGVGQHQMFAAQHYRWRHPRTMITSGGLGTMGYGVPSAIGAKVADPEKIVIDIDGDASFSMTAMELATAHASNIGTKFLVLNNEFQGMVLQWQDLFYDHRYSHTHMINPDFCALANAMHVHAIRVESLSELPAKMKEFLEYDNTRPVLLEAKIIKDEHVYPMVPAGRALDEGVVHPDLEPKLKQSS